MKIMGLFGIVFLASAVSAGDLTLARNGKTDYRIIYTAGEKEAAQELKLHLDQITGAHFPMLEESKAGTLSGPALYVGNTKFAAEHAGNRNFSDQEWLAKNYGKNILFTGGKTRGTLYSVYVFLEQQLGCAWFAWDTAVIPKQAEVILKDFEHHGFPSFESRNIVDDTYNTDRWSNKPRYAKKTLFKKRLRASLSYGKFFKTWPEESTLYAECHNFYDFLNPKEYFKEHPEYFSMNKEGKRFHGNLGPTMQGGAFCMTNPEVREIFYRRLVEYIRKDRASLPPEKWPSVYDISQMDSCPFICLCPECRKITEKEGSESGLQLHFLNPLAERIAKEYPEIKIRTFAYASTKLAPAHIRPAANLIIRWCNLYGYNDCYRPITSPFNAEQKKQLDDWKKTGANLAVWAYWNMGGQFFGPPRLETMVDAIKPDFEYYLKSGVTSLFIQAERDEHNIQNFYRLQLYVGHKLAADITGDPEQLISQFMQAYYGPAVKPMTRFLNNLRTAVKNEKARMRSTETARPYCTEKFMKQVWHDLSEAYRLTIPGSLYRKHVEDEMITPLFVILKNTGWTFGDRAAMLNRYKILRKREINAIPAGTRKQRMLERYESDLRNFVKINLPVPEQFKDREVIMIGWPKLGWAAKTTKDAITDDPDSVTGKALVTRPTDSSGKSTASGHNMKNPPHPGFTPLDFGAYDYTNKKSLHWKFSKRIPKDEKYHWYRLGTYRLGPGSFAWGFYWSTRCDLAAFYRPDDGMETLNDWDIWVSAKFTGPAYVKGSNKKNEIYWDQVMLVKPGRKGKK